MKPINLNTKSKKNPIMTSLAKTTLSALLVLTLPTVLAEEKNAKLFEPFSPKPSHQIPAGWELKILKGSKVENVTTLKNNKEVKVTVPAYELVPVQTNPTTEETKILVDPGFQPDLANNQTNTIGAILTDYSESALTLETKLQTIIDTLESKLGQAAPVVKNAPKKPNNTSK